MLNPAASKMALQNLFRRIPVVQIGALYRTLMFLSQKMLSKNVTTLDMRAPAGGLPIGDFQAEPVPVDHSSPEALAFILKAKGKTVVYTGDFRAHGRKGGLFDRLMARCGQNPDVLLLEGTMVGSGRGSSLCSSETKLEEKIVSRINGVKSGPILANFSPTNLDRVISFLLACGRTGSELVVDLFTAFVYHELRKLDPGMLPFDKVRVLYLRGHADALGKSRERDFLVRMMDRRIHFNLNDALFPSKSKASRRRIYCRQ